MWTDGQKQGATEEVWGPDSSDEGDEPGIGGPQGSAVYHSQRWVGC